MTSHRVIIGSRGSELALWQANWVKSQLEHVFPGLNVEILGIATKGDKILDSSLSQIGGKGVFTREIDEALLDGRIDISAHSLKDLPTEIPHGIGVRAVTEREDIHDVFISHPHKALRSLDELPQGAKIATGSLRRKCQLLHHRPDLEIVDIRGNVPTRLRKLDSSNWDGLILAKAGLVRLNLTDRIAETIPTEIILPAVGQGALGIEIRANDQQTGEIVSAINHERTAKSTQAERTLLRYVEGGCQVPLGAYARIENDVFMMEAIIGSLDGKKVVRSTIHGNPSEADRLATALAKALLRGGGDKILREIRDGAPREVPIAQA
jgi:hydroxymethylbilane synthase